MKKMIILLASCFYLCLNAQVKIIGTNEHSDMDLHSTKVYQLGENGLLFYSYDKKKGNLVYTIRHYSSDNMLFKESSFSVKKAHDKNYGEPYYSDYNSTFYFNYQDETNFYAITYNAKSKTLDSVSVLVPKGVTIQTAVWTKKYCILYSYFFRKRYCLKIGAAEAQPQDLSLPDEQQYYHAQGHVQNADQGYLILTKNQSKAISSHFILFDSLGKLEMNVPFPDDPTKYPYSGRVLKNKDGSYFITGNYWLKCQALPPNAGNFNTPSFGTYAAKVRNGKFEYLNFYSFSDEPENSDAQTFSIPKKIIANGDSLIISSELFSKWTGTQVDFNSRRRFNNQYNTTGTQLGHDVWATNLVVVAPNGKKSWSEFLPTSTIVSSFSPDGYFCPRSENGRLTYACVLSDTITVFSFDLKNRKIKQSTHKIDLKNYQFSDNSPNVQGISHLRDNYYLLYWQMKNAISHLGWGVALVQID
jgi:hypothetical protein